MKKIPKMLMVLIHKVYYGLRPKFNKPVPACYKELMEKCWDKDPNKRPSFEEIVYQLKTDHRFFSGNVNKEQFLEYVECTYTSNSMT